MLDAQSHAAAEKELRKEISQLRDELAHAQQVADRRLATIERQTDVIVKLADQLDTLSKHYRPLRRSTNP